MHGFLSFAVTSLRTTKYFFKKEFTDTPICNVKSMHDTILIADMEVKTTYIREKNRIITIRNTLTSFQDE